LIKANFKLSKTTETTKESNIEQTNEPKMNLTPTEFEEYVIKSGAAGSFMIFRSNKKEDELGLDEL